MIPYTDLQAQYASIREEIHSALNEVLESAAFILGPKVEQFERDFAAYCGTREAVACNSGTSALHLALLAAGIGEGDEVITVPFTFVATIAAIRYTGAKPVLVDIDSESFTLEPNRLEAAITDNTRAIIPVHLYGQCADMDPILEIAGKHDLVVIEDAAQAHGAEYKGRRAGSIGRMGCFSFYPGKNLGAYGEGGAVVTSDSDYTEKMRLYRSWGERSKGLHDVLAYNYRMDGIQGAVLGVKLKYIERWTGERRRVAELYGRALADAAVTIPREMPGNRHVYHVYAIRSAERDSIRKALLENDIQCGVHYPLPVHLQEGYRDLGYRHGDFPEAEAAAKEVLSLPIFPEMTESQVNRVAEVVREAVR